MRTSLALLTALVVMTIAVAPASASVLWDGSGSPTSVGFVEWSDLSGGSQGFVFNTESGVAKPGITYQETMGANSDSNHYHLDSSLLATEMVYANGWSVEARLEALSNNGDLSQATGQSVTLQLGDETKGFFIQFAPEQISWWTGDSVQHAIDISPGYHTYRVEADPNAMTGRLIIDGVSTTDVTMTEVGWQAMYFGDMTGSSGGEANWDYVQINLPTQIPEPSAIVLVAGALLGLMMSRRRK